MLYITKFIRVTVAGLACLWPLVFFTGLPAAASVLTTDLSAVEMQATPELQQHRGQRVAGQNVFQRHESSFFLDADPTGSIAGNLHGAGAEPQRPAAGSPLSLGGVALIAVLLLAAFNARKRRSRAGLAQG